MTAVSSRPIELLAPAANAEVARQAILHGADAVYIGPPSHGARKSAANSIKDIKSLCDFAHRFGVKIYVTVNCIVYDNEIKTVERMCRDLYYAGVDALIVQDMSLLRMDIPDIQIHASTQCDNRTVAKARFMQDSGFSQIVLARELTLSEIRKICNSVDIPVECFIHGALCVSYSGRCHASQVCMGRSANRGECAQICRLPMTLTDSAGKVLASDRHLLSLKDFNLSDRIDDLLKAGVSSFKIEGRLKDVAYVKNVTAFYRRRIDEIIKNNPQLYHRSSFGSSEISFNPCLEKSFNRGFTHYFLDGPSPGNIASIRTPKSMGECVNDISQLNNGDGISFFDKNGQYTGLLVNRIENGRIIPNRPQRIPVGVKIRRTSDIVWQKILAKPSAIRTIAVDILLDNTGLTASDERGVFVRISLDCRIDKARNPQNRHEQFSRLGDTIYRLRNFNDYLGETAFIPNSDLTAARRRLIAALDDGWKCIRRVEHRAAEDKNAVYPHKNLDFHDNVANSLAEEFYDGHGATVRHKALEVCGRYNSDMPIMSTRYCILRQLGLCLKTDSSHNLKPPFYLESQAGHFRVEFSCGKCGMQLFLENEKKVSRRQK